MTKRLNSSVVQSPSKQQPGRRHAAPSDGLIGSLLLAPLLAGCATGGGGSDAGGLPASSLDPPAQAKESQDPGQARVIEGKAINGYLDLAVVYVDLNQDGLLSAGEPMSVSREGSFSLRSDEGSSVVVAAIQSLSATERTVANEALLALGIDLSDSPQTSYVSDGERKAFSGRLESNVTGIAESINITPLTSLSASLQRVSGLNAVEADELVQSKFGVIPSKDYLSADDAVARKLSQAVSDFYQIAYTALESDGPSQQTSDSLTRSLLSAADSLPSSVSMGELLSSPVDLRSVLLATASDLGRELDIASASSRLNDAFLARDLGAPGTPVRLKFDTGRSMLDGVTSNPAIQTVALVDPEARWVYGLSVKSVDLSGGVRWSDIQWTDEDPTGDLPEGTYRIFVREAGLKESHDLQFVEFTLDKTSPSGMVSASDVFNLSQQAYFESYIPGFMNSLDFSDAHAGAVRSEVSESEEIQYLVSTDGDVSHDDPAWHSSINLYNMPGQERGFYLSTRVVDFAGNTSGISTAPFRVDQLKPLMPDLSTVKVAADTGIYDWDNYSQTISLEDFYLSLRLGESPDDHALLYSVAGGGERRVDISERLSFDDLEDGSYRIDFRQVDRADNFSGVESLHFVLDRLAPVIEASEIAWISSEYSRPHRDGGPLETFDEWGQYGYRHVDSDSEVVWFDFGRPDVLAQYDIQFRFVDRAGNFSDAMDLGRHELRSPLLALPEEQSSTLFSILASGVSMEDEVSRWLDSNDAFQEFYFHTDFSFEGSAGTDGPVAARRGLSLSSGALSSGAFEMSSLRDEIDRGELSFGSESFFVSGLEGRATEFMPSIDSERSSVILLGGSESDRFSDLRPGDIFLGAGGVDIVATSSGLTPLGLAFLSDAEKDSLRSLVAGVPLSNSPLASLDGAYMVYLGQEGAGDEGIAISNAEAFVYQKLKEEFLTIQFNERLDRFFFIHDASDNEFFYGGLNTGALGLGGSDLLSGGDGDDFLVGGSAPYGGEDVVYGYAGNDVLVGGDYQTLTYSKYSLLGGDGDDAIYLGNGSGVAEGGRGRDTFHVAPIPGSVAEMSLVIRDFSPSEDKIVFHFDGVSALFGGVFISRDSEEVIVDLAQMFLAADSTERTPAALESLLRIQVDGLGGSDLETVLQDWFVFEGLPASIWSDLADGWVSIA